MEGWTAAATQYRYQLHPPPVTAPSRCPETPSPTLPTALAAPVEEGMMLAAAPRPPRQSFLLGESTVFWVAVVACTVVIRPSRISKFSWTTCTASISTSCTRSQ